MKSGLEGRNNRSITARHAENVSCVSMKSGLEGRNNRSITARHAENVSCVSMKSGLEGRNNMTTFTGTSVILKPSQ